jgi:hypothetical protein
VTLVGVALLPDAETTNDLVAFSRRWAGEIDPPVLGKLTNLPHVSIYQLPVRGPQEFADTLRGYSCDAVGSAVFGALRYQPVTWLFADVQRRPVMLHMQREIVERVSHLLDTSQLRPDDELAGYSADERDHYLRYGYRYIGESFRPHITLGRSRTDSLSLPVECLEEYRSVFEGRTINFGELVAYEAGAFGNLQRVLVSLEISRTDAEPR